MKHTQRPHVVQRWFGPAGTRDGVTIRGIVGNGRGLSSLAVGAQVFYAALTIAGWRGNTLNRCNTEGANVANYVLMYKGGDMEMIEEMGATHAAAWTAWLEGLGAALVEDGTPFGSSVAVAADGSVSTGASSGLTGYSVIAADSLDAATALAQSCPFLAINGSIEVYETVPMS